MNKNTIWLLIAVGIGVAYFATRKGEPADLITRAYQNYYGGNDSTIGPLFPEQLKRTYQEAQFIGAQEGGLKDIWNSFKTWLAIRNAPDAVDDVSGEGF